MKRVKVTSASKSTTGAILVRENASILRGNVIILPTTIQRATTPLTLDEQTALLRQCERIWDVTEERNVRDMLPTALLHDMMCHYAKTYSTYSRVRELAEICTQALPAALDVQHVGRLPTVTLLFFFPCRCIQSCDIYIYIYIYIYTIVHCMWQCPHACYAR
jgi:hypothetical protein